MKKENNTEKNSLKKRKKENIINIIIKVLTCDIESVLYNTFYLLKKKKKKGK